MHKDFPQKYTGRVNRDTEIVALVENSCKTTNPVVAGRVIGLIDGEGALPGDNAGGVERGFVLQDATGRLVIAAEVLPEVGAIVEVMVGRSADGSYIIVGEAVVLADCEDFYISLKSSPNYQRMLIDQNLRDNLVKRGAVMGAMREYFVGRGFTEVDTPCLVRLPGMEPYLDVFKTHFEADFSAEQKLSEEMYLITSPEYQMKKLLVGGLEKIFQITKSFRNKETFSERHNPEFTILEWYRAYASYLEIMEDTEGLVKFLWEKFGGRDVDGQLGILKVAGQEVVLMSKWRRLTVLDAFKEFAGIDEKTFFDLNLFRAEVKKRGYTISDEALFEECFFVIFMNEIEGKLGFGQPVILYDYPLSMAALSKRCQRDERFAERFEVYVGGMELCNAFTELNDPVEQERRLNLEREERIKLGKDIYSVDKSFIEALKFGMPPAGGNALGVDRLIMLILGTKDIREVLSFPHSDL